MHYPLKRLKNAIVQKSQDQNMQNQTLTETVSKMPFIFACTAGGQKTYMVVEECEESLVVLFLHRRQEFLFRHHTDTAWKENIFSDLGHSEDTDYNTFYSYLPLLRCSLSFETIFA